MHEQSYSSDLQDQELAGLSSHRGATGSSPMAREALKRRGSLTIWFDPGMSMRRRQTGENGGEKVGHGSGGMSPLRAA